MASVKKYWEKLEEFEIAKSQLYNIGFKNSYPFHNNSMIQYTATNGNHFHIYLDSDNPTKVTCLRAQKPGSIQGYGLIGNFVGGKGRHRRFSFKTPHDLKEKLEKWVF